ncbi:MAG: autotransporter domain-containing protein [Phaeodactylibacter sp.]|nr:autotransporter domain-containing protein [Phaeodactylibacter sp.]
MKRYLFAGLMLLTLSLNAQIGITGGYRINNAPDWDYPSSVSFNDDLNPLANSWAVGVDYWIPLGQTRIDLLPELSFGQSVQEMTLISDQLEFTQNAYSLFLNANIYIMDLEGDCDCPTFSKSGDFFQKGFFLQLSPGISYFQNTIERLNADVEDIEDDAIAYSVGVGAGLDIGLSDILTLTPMVGFRYYFPSEWAGLDDILLTAEPDPLFETESNIRQVWAGLRLGVRFDQR